MSKDKTKVEVNAINSTGLEKHLHLTNKDGKEIAVVSVYATGLIEITYPGGKFVDRSMSIMIESLGTDNVKVIFPVNNGEQASVEHVGTNDYEIVVGGMVIKEHK